MTTFNRAFRQTERTAPEGPDAGDLRCARCIVVVGSPDALDARGHCVACADTVDAWEEAVRWREVVRDREAANDAGDRPADAACGSCHTTLLPLDDDGLCAGCREAAREDGDDERDSGGGELDADAALEADTPLGMADDGEPPDLDSDAGYDPYTGGAEDDGYDTGRDGDYGDD